MKINELKNYCLLIENKTSPEVAKLTGMSVSGILRHISNLEKELKTKLFKREGKRLEPTDSGIKFYKHALNIINRYEIAIENLKNLEGKKEFTGTFTIQSSQELYSYLLMGPIDKFMTLNRSIDYRLFADAGFANNGLNEIDAYITLEDNEQKGFQKIYLYSVPLHTYVGKAATSKEGIESQKVIIYGREGENYNPILNWHVKYIPTREGNYVYTNSWACALNMIADSIGIGVLPSMRKLIQEVPIERALPAVRSENLDLFLYYKSDSNKQDIIKALAEHLNRSLNT